MNCCRSLQTRQRDGMNIAAAKDKLIFGFVVLNVISGTAVGAFQMIIPLYAASLQATTAQIGLIRGISGLGFLLSVLPAGFLADYYGAKKMYIAGSLISAVLSLLIPFFGTVGMFMLIVGIDSVFRSTRFTALNASFFRYLAKIGQSKAGWFKGSMSIGLTFLGVILGGVMVDAMSFSQIFITFFVLTLIPTAMVFFLYRAAVRRKVVDEGATLVRAMIIPQVRELIFALGEQAVRFALLTECVSAASFATFSTFLAVIVITNYGFSSVAASILLVIEGTTFITTVFSAGNMLLRLSPWNYYFVSFSAAALGLFILTFANSFFWFAVAAGIYGIGIGMMNLITTTKLAELKGEKGKIAGALSAATGLGITIGPPVAGFLGQSLGNQMVFAVYSAAMFILAGRVFFYRLQERKANRLVDDW